MGHIPKSLNIPYNTANLDSLIQRLSLNKKFLILYCSNSHCNAAEILARKLTELGCQKIRIYQGGWEDWMLHNIKTGNRTSY
jgi:3-mercaptopyruvate sulfurtransferase SseA